MKEVISPKNITYGKHAPSIMDSIGEEESNWYDGKQVDLFQLIGHFKLGCVVEDLPFDEIKTDLNEKNPLPT